MGETTKMNLTKAALCGLVLATAHGATIRQDNSWMYDDEYFIPEGGEGTCSLTFQSVGGLVFDLYVEAFYVVRDFITNWRDNPYLSVLYRRTQDLICPAL